MVFSSIFFLAVFLPIFLAIYYLTPLRLRSPLILAASYSFYAWWRIDFTALFALVTLVTYLISVPLERTGSRRWLVLGVIANLLTLGYFKYFNFGVEAWNALFQTQWEGWRVILPIGVSFYIFHCISYLIDIYRKDAEVAKSYWDFAAFTALFPHLIAGPVLRYKDLAWQFQSRTHTWEKFNEGVLRFAMGFAKKVMIADTLAPLADMAFAQPNPTMAESWLGILAYAAQLYFDFSGYSSMAVGLALMMGFRFIENFNHPYTSRSITEFWQRWHISLSTWLRDYLYIPLGGNRKGAVRTYINLFLTMLLGGLWHGANFTFLLWGAWHGAFLALERLLGGKSGKPYPALLAWPLTFFCVLIGWVLFRAPNMKVALDFYAGMFGQQGMAISDTLAWQINPLMWLTLIVAYVIAIFTRKVMGENKRDWHEPSWAAAVSLPKQAAIMGLLMVSIAKLIAQSHSPFLYFQF
jgi:alginate O-acetyltransferase complex protein AlgI